MRLSLPCSIPLALALLGAALPILAQPANILAVTKWRFQFTYTAQGSHKTESAEWEYNATAKGDFVLDTKGRNRWTGTPATTVNFKVTGKTFLGNCTIEESFTFNGQVPSTPSGSLDLLPNGYFFDMGARTILGTKTNVAPSPCPDVNNVSHDASATWGVIWTDRNQYPAQGTTLSGTLTKSDLNISVNAMGIALKPIDAKITYTLTPLDQDDLILELTPSSSYENWRPTASGDGDDGTNVSVTAELKRRDGGAPQQVKIATLLWELADTSRVPGVAINWPGLVPDSRPDLHFNEALSATSSVVRKPLDEEGQKLEITYIRADGLTDTVEVYPRDWGGWSTLKATAKLSNGQTITGRMKEANEDHVRIPNRDPNRVIAKVWLREQNAAGAADNSDLDDVPLGDGNNGDGLTLYEEYRGFFANGQRVGSDPKVKDYFVVNYAGAIVEPGISHFQAISGLKVHRLRPEEVDHERVVNSNTDGAPTTGPQHAVEIRTDESLDGVARAAGGPSNPGGIRYVGVPAEWGEKDTASPFVSYFGAVVAHELMHSVNVYHHGEQDRKALWTREDGILSEELDGSMGLKREIKVFRESGEDITDRASTGTRWLGSYSGQHSGAENCVMRYDNAQAYASSVVLRNRYASFTEVVGVLLCNTSAGTGVNEEGRLPQSRYGPASPGRGACMNQILVNDKVNPPRR